MTNQHPITPPSELLAKWFILPISTEELLVLAAQWGANQELEACCEWLDYKCPSLVRHLRSDRRPKPPSLKEDALAVLQDIADQGPTPEQIRTIRRALESIND